MTREPDLDELIGTETPGEERERLQRVHDLLLQAGAPPELSPELAAGPTLALTLARRRRRRPRALVLLAAALCLALVFFAGYVVGNNGGGTSTSAPLKELKLKGTSLAPKAQAVLDVWHPSDGNWPMKLTVVGLPKLPARTYYEVYVVRHGQILGSCGSFRVRGHHAVTLRMNAPYPLEPGDSWVVTRLTAGGVEPGNAVLRPVRT
jgi:hypothetical protein